MERRSTAQPTVDLLSVTYDSHLVRVRPVLTKLFCFVRFACLCARKIGLVLCGCAVNRGITVYSLLAGLFSYNTPFSFAGAEKATDQVNFRSRSVLLVWYIIIHTRAYQFFVWLTSAILLLVVPSNEIVTFLVVSSNFCRSDVRSLFSL